MAPASPSPRSRSVPARRRLAGRWALGLTLLLACGDEGPVPSAMGTAPTPGRQATGHRLDAAAGPEAQARPSAATSGPTSTPAATPDAPPFVSHRAGFEELAARLQASQNPYLGRAQLPPLRATLKRDDLPDTERVNTLAGLAWHELRLGEVDAAVEHVGAAIALGEGLGVPPRALVGLRRFAALAHLRAAEVANCILRHNRDCCLLPIAGEGVHVDREPALAAREQLRAVLAAEPSSLEARWLLNVVAMVLGEYPEGVPEGRRIPPEAFESEVDVGRFVDRAPELGLDAFTHCGGVVIQDLDADGHLDIVTSSFAPDQPLQSWAGGPGLTFTETSSAWRLDDQLGGLNLIAGDSDDDGDLDLLVLRGAWLFDDGQIRNSLLENDGAAVFRDVTQAAGLAAPPHPTQAACFGDFDNDGDLDLYVANESRVEASPPGSSYPSQLFLNDGSGRFVDVGPAAGVTNDRFAKGVAAGDYDNDGDLDLYVSNTSANRLYRNEQADGALTFTDVAEELDVAAPYGRSFAAWFFDHDNDGWLDLFVGDFSSTLREIASDALGVPDASRRPRLYRNLGGRFVDVSQQAGLVHDWLPMGANFGDVDHDGWLDIYLATGDPGYETLVPNVLLVNDGGTGFRNGTTAAGLGHLQKGHGVAFADLDHDGDQDLFNQLGGFYPGDAFHNALFVNPGHGHHFTYLRLVGDASNSHGLGARIALTTVEGRQLHRAVGSVSSFGGSPFRQEIGLGEAAGIARIVVTWPSGARTELEAPPMDRLLVIHEDGGRLEARELP